MRGEKTHSVRGLTRIYRTGSDEVHALRGVDLELCSGELVALLGPSGSGKSTLLNLLGGIDRPDGGEIWFRGAELTRFDDRALARYRRRHVGFVFQSYNLIPSLTARENVELACAGAEAPVAAADALELVGLRARMDHFPGQLSGGEQQRAAVARAIAKRPDLLRSWSSSSAAAWTWARPPCSSLTMPRSRRWRTGSSPSSTAASPKLAATRRAARRATFPGERPSERAADSPA